MRIDKLIILLLILIAVPACNTPDDTLEARVTELEHKMQAKFEGEVKREKCAMNLHDKVRYATQIAYDTNATADEWMWDVSEAIDKGVEEYESCLAQ